MAISTYTELQTAIGNWTDRTDLALRFPEYIALFEAQVNRKLRVRPMNVGAQLTPSGGLADLPTDYLSWNRLTWNGSPRRDLEYVRSDYFWRNYSTDRSDIPTIFTIRGDEIQINSTDTTNLVLYYSQKVPALSVSAPTNWLLDSHPDAYLYGSLVQLAAATSDMEQGLAWNALAEKAINEIWSLDFAQHGVLTQRQLGPNP